MTAPQLLNRDQVDRELATLRAGLDAMSSSLLDLENHPGHELLRNYPQAGRTLQEWTQVRDGIAGMWADLDRVRSIVATSAQVRARRSKPDQADLAELDYLLHGEPIDLGGQPIPFAQRSLTGPATTINRIGLAGLTTRMNDAFQLAGDLVAQVDATSTAVRDGLIPVQDRLARARRQLTDPAGPSAEAGAAEQGRPGRSATQDPDLVALEKIDDKIVDLTERSVSDALAIADPTAEIAAISEELAILEARIAELATVRSGWSTALSDLRQVAVQISDSAQRTRQARALVAAKIRTGPLPEPVDRLGVVNAAIDALSPVVGWRARADALTATRETVRQALDRARSDEQLVTGLLDRREELKGRLLGYRAKAIRTGCADRPAIATGYDRAAAALAAPCDLATATRAIGEYRDLVNSIANDDPGRTA